jgi:hypothetical protein
LYYFYSLPLPDYKGGCSISKNLTAIGFIFWSGFSSSYSHNSSIKHIK